MVTALLGIAETVTLHLHGSPLARTVLHAPISQGVRSHPRSPVASKTIRRRTPTLPRPKSLPRGVRNLWRILRRATRGFFLSNTRAREPNARQTTYHNAGHQLDSSHIPTSFLTMCASRHGGCCTRSDLKLSTLRYLAQRKARANPLQTAPCHAERVRPRFEMQWTRLRVDLVGNCDESVERRSTITSTNGW